MLFVQQYFHPQSHVENQIFEFQVRMELGGFANSDDVELALTEHVEEGAVLVGVHEQVGTDPLHNLEHPVVERLLVLPVVRLIL